MKQEMVTISRVEYEELKKKAKMAEIDEELIKKIKRSLEDVKHGRISEWRPNKKLHKA